MILEPIYRRALEIIKGSVLDLGCGSGEFASMVKYRYCGIDKNPLKIESAKQLNPGKRFLCMDALSAPRYFKYFDYITAFEFLEHIYFDIELINMMPIGQKFIFSVPNYWSKNHVRVYDEEIIRERYMWSLDIKFIEEFVIYKRIIDSNIIYLCYARKL
jgi:SAM-dependent methyltransferase